MVRFDRPKVHMVSAAGLLEADPVRALTDYSELFRLTKLLTRDSSRETEQFYRRMCFNILTVNQDDHLKNFAFIFDDRSGFWKLSPAYDLTYCITAYGEHTTTVCGKGKNITPDDLIKLGKSAGLSKGKCKEIAEEIEQKTQVLRKYFEGGR